LARTSGFPEVRIRSIDEEDRFRLERGVHHFVFDCSLQDVNLIRYFSGDLRANLFVRGDETGVVRIWDIRNLDGYQRVSGLLHIRLEVSTF
jgi:hypothetical protein